eukprot:1592077-Pleurochrysis_carterae.AAC.1
MAVQASALEATGAAGSLKRRNSRGHQSGDAFVNSQQSSRGGGRTAAAVPSEALGSDRIGESGGADATSRP